MTKSVKRLYKDFQPSNYKLALNLDADKLTFTGSVQITGHKSGRPSQRLTLHQKGLNISSATAVFHDKTTETPIKIDRINTHGSFDELRLHAAHMLFPGSYTITLKFSGKITKQMHGLYPCYFTHDGIEKMLLATQFESHHAREVFPCVDEPEAKATFDLTLVTDAGGEVLGNTVVASQNTSGPKVTTVFEQTPIMSTYLLAFAVGEIHAVEAKTKQGTIVKTWSTVAQPKSSLEFANDQAVKVLEYFTDYFDTPFPLKKIDQIALPDFESGAMENWGLVTYREIALLTEAKNRSLTSEQYVAMVVAHELAHQWFGNLVTMKWWDDLWLNESFASIMEHIALDALHPDWHQWEGYVSSDVIACSNRDIYKDVQPVRVDVNHPDEIGTLFDPAIVYAKGGRLLKMLREYIGDDAFRKGLKAYFDKHAYKNTVADDLWSALSEASGQNIHDFMTPWLTQSGQPVVSLTGTAKKVTATQSRFILDNDEDASLWPIPTLSEGVAPALFTDKEAVLTDTKAPLVLNQNGSGHYIVNYGEGELKAQVDEAFAARILPSETRVNYLNDLLLLARRGDSPLTETLEVVAKSGDEPRDAVWSLMSRAVGLASGLVEGDNAASNNLKAFRRSVAEPLHSKLGWDDANQDDPNTKLLRLTALAWTLGGEDANALAEAKKRYDSAKTIEDINAEHRGMILASLIRQEPKLYFDDLIKTYKDSQNPEVQIAISGGLTAVKDTSFAKKLIAEALGDQKSGFVRSQDVFRWFAYLMRNRHTREMTWEWFIGNWDRLYKEFSESKSLDYFVTYAANPINTVAGQKQFNEFFEPKLDIVALTRNIKIAQAEITARVAWRERDEAKIATYASQFQSS